MSMEFQAAMSIHGPSDYIFQLVGIEACKKREGSLYSYALGYVNIFGTIHYGVGASHERK